MLIHIALLFQLIYYASSLRVCTRRHFTIDHQAIFQRVELPTAEKCLERCIENIEYCRSAVFIEHKKKRLGFCVIHTVNSETDGVAFHPDASLDPQSTVFELLSKCPQFADDRPHRISNAHKKLLEFSGKEGLEKSLRADASFPDRDRFGLDEVTVEKNDRYAVMKSLDSEPDPHNPFDNSPTPSNPTYSRRTDTEADRMGPKSPFEGLSPIKPAMVMYQGRIMNPSTQCKPGVPCVPTLASLDSGPCPARQGDPCAPKPPCLEQGCYHVDEPPLTAPVEWNEWSHCSVSCGVGVRTRTCGGSGCPGVSSLPCSLSPCAEWSLWGAWSPCSATCGQSSERTRTRTCNYGRDCPGASMMVDACPVLPCPNWSGWGEWEGCAISCGRGMERRSRKCENGLFCPGLPFEDRVCDRGACPHWMNWMDWTSCSSSCGGGQMIRTRECDGGSCTGASEERLLCNQQPCPDWTQWTQWTVCDDKCGEESVRLRNRICLYRGVPFAGCDGSAQDQMSCPVRECATWSEWTDWSECSATCGQGNQMRTRRCDGGSDCVGPASELRFCQQASCPYWGEWTGWGGCSVSCGLGVCERKRKCITDELLNIPSDLEEFADEMPQTESDKAKAALIARSKHIKMIGNGTEGVRRAPLSGSLENAGTCDGPDFDRKQCDAGPCCMWEEWTDWSPCIGCGSNGISKRTRDCMSELGLHSAMPPLSFQEDAMRPVFSVGPQYVSPNRRVTMSDPSMSGGLNPIVPLIHRGKRHALAFQIDSAACHCPGPSSETRTCPRTSPCADVAAPTCQWTDWGQWCGCTACRAGREVRRRYCDRESATGMSPTRPDPDCRCNGQDTEERSCAVEESCFASREPAVSASSDGDNNRNDRYIPIDSRINSVQIETSRSAKYPLDRKDSAFSTTPFPYPVCRWSRWSDWSECHSTRRRERNRFCIGSDELVSNCQCMGLSTDEEQCDPADAKDERPRNIVPGEEGTEKTEAEFSTEDDSELDSGIDSALKTSDAEESSEEVTQAGQTVAREQATSSKIRESTDDETVYEPLSRSCEWTRWSLWSDCTASCGTGEMLRKRRCPCGDSNCGGGIETEISACEKAACSERRMHPVFSIQ